MQKYSNEVMQLKAQMKDEFSQLEAKPISNESESLPMPQQLICNKIDEFKFMGEQENMVPVPMHPPPSHSQATSAPCQLLRPYKALTKYFISPLVESIQSHASATTQLTFHFSTK